MKKPSERPILRVRRAKSVLQTKIESIPNRVYKLLRFYCYAVEEFGMHLQQLARRGTLTLEHRSLRNALGFKCSDFDYRPTAMYHREQPLQLTNAPNAYCWANREFLDMDTGEIRSIYMPHCTALRLLIASMDSGIWLSSLQWLDRRNWDTWNINPAADGGVFPMHIRSGMARAAKTVYVSPGLRDLLKREECFQESFTDAGSYAPAHYDGSESRFDQVRPLFRDAHSGMPIGERAYHGVWKRLMSDFEWFYRTHTGEHLVLPTLPPIACRAIYQINHFGARVVPSLVARLAHFDELLAAQSAEFGSHTND